MASASVNLGKLIPVVRAEWPSFNGSAVPERQDAYEVSYDFIRAMHHRLSQPVTTLRCSLEVMLATNANNARIADQVTRAMEQSDRVMELIVAFRALFEADRVEKDLCPASLTYVLSEVVEDLRPLGRDRGIEIVFPWNAAAVHVRASRPRMRQAMWNVIQNCLELAADRDEVCLTLHAVDGRAEIEIRDRCEMAEADGARIFDPFSYCVNGTNGRKVSNLPLALMQRMVLAAGGDVQSRVTPYGRRFKLDLPTCAVSS